VEVVILRDADAVGAYAADLILRGVRSGRITVLGVATGSSPLPVYRSLRERWIPEIADLTAFALDEYVGLPYEHPQSYHSVIDREVTVPLKLDPAKVHVPDGAADDLDAACARYEAAIAEAGGIDLQLLGIGRTGHIGFNEPSSSLTSRTRIKTLTPQTRRDNARFFGSADDVPIHCMTQGLGTILAARTAVLVAHGQRKARAIAQAVEGPVSSMCPGSVLQLHPDAVVVVDEAAAAELALADYYRFVADNLP
jgi:glucosamine-6-phosphate deaminase